MILLASFRYHQVHIKLVVKRKHGYYMFSIVLILFLLGQLVWMTFLINPQDFSDRFNTNMALMLTAITYKSLVYVCIVAQCA